MNKNTALPDNAHDTTYKKSTINKSLPFDFCRVKESNLAPTIDAIYIPTQEHRDKIYSNIDTLLSNTKYIYLLFSNKKSSWVNEVHNDRLIIKENLSSYFDLSAYNKHATSQNIGVKYNPAYDIPAKRTYALNHAMERRYKTIGLLDDDIRLTKNDLARVRYALTRSALDMASYHVLDYPDVSTIDHIHRIVTKEPSRVSIGGNCLFMRTSIAHTFFPQVYNDDWLFLFAHSGAVRIGSLGIVRQRAYAPWKVRARIMHEQFGEILVDGIKTNCISGRHPFSGHCEYWSKVLCLYREKLQKLRAQTKCELFGKRLDDAFHVVSEVGGQDLVDFLDSYNRGNKLKWV